VTDLAAIARRPFGRTGHQSSRAIFGAAALGSMSQERADAVLPVLLRHGVNHLDTAASYGDAELRLAPWLAAHPGEFFVATKTGERRGDAARAELERSLVRMGVDHVDLVQLHNLVEEDEWATAHGPGGAVEALVKARDEGLVRFLGVTGHGLRIAGMHRRSLERHDYDSVLLPFSFILLQDAGYRAEVEALLERCAARDVAVQTIKSIARRRWTDGDDRPRFSWYEPLDDPASVARAVQFVLSHEQVFLNTTSDARVLPDVLRAAASTTVGVRPSDEQLAADVVGQGMRPLFDGGALERI
jgi:aryl-alcohol dehydrogenase-like predicted oxidoreductase